MQARTSPIFKVKAKLGEMRAHFVSTGRDDLAALIATPDDFAFAFDDDSIGLIYSPALTTLLRSLKIDFEISNATNPPDYQPFALINESSLAVLAGWDHSTPIDDNLLRDITEALEATRLTREKLNALATLPQTPPDALVCAMSLPTTNRIITALQHTPSNELLVVEDMRRGEHLHLQILSADPAIGPAIQARIHMILDRYSIQYIPDAGRIVIPSAADEANIRPALEALHIACNPPAPAAPPAAPPAAATLFAASSDKAGSDENSNPHP